MAKAFYYRLHSGRLTIHISRAELEALHGKIAKVLAQRGRGHRTYYVGVSFKGHCYHKLSIHHHAAHKREAADRAAAARPWVTL